MYVMGINVHLNFLNKGVTIGGKLSDMAAGVSFPFFCLFDLHVYHLYLIIHDPIIMEKIYKHNQIKKCFA